MKKLLIAMLVLTFILATAVAALAGTGRGGNNYTSYGNLGVNYKDGGAPGDPHGGYGSSTNVCSFCHAVHNAGTNGAGLNAYKLTRSTDSTVLGACNYCHVAGIVVTKLPYDEAGILAAGLAVEAKHTLGNAVIPDSTVDANVRLGGNGLDCKDCHEAAPHAANESSKLISNARGSITDLCASCHNKNFDNAGFGTGVGDPGGSHPMVLSDDGDTRPGGRTSPVVPNNTDTRTCQACHANTGGVGLFPHVSGASRFLTTAAGALNANGSAGQLDVVCLACHGDAGRAVGTNF